MSKKIKILMISDICLAPSGVGSQSRYIIDALIKSEKFQIIQFGGAMKHQSYQPIKLQEYGDDLVIIPTDGFGNKEMLRTFIRQEKPEALLIFTDPRFFVWLFEMANEISPLLPIIYYNIWDAFPFPKFNRPYYLSCDKLICISKLTEQLVKGVAPEIDSCYLPHAVDDNIFKPLPALDVEKFRKNTVPNSEDKLLFFWNSRNARRKNPGTLIFWFNEYLDKIGRDKAKLIMHTDVFDENGPNLEEILRFLGMTNGEVMFSREKIPPEALSLMYNMSDCTLSLSEAEGYGLSTHESLSCGTPIIVPETGGLQEQVQSLDGKEQFGFMIPSKCRYIAGSQTIPYIYEDRVLKEDYIEALVKFTNLSQRERRELGLKGRAHILQNYNFQTYKQKWVEIMLDVYEKGGSWETRKNNQTKWNIKKV